jgi:hypothetical protein
MHHVLIVTVSLLVASGIAVADDAAAVPAATATAAVVAAKKPVRTVAAAAAQPRKSSAAATETTPAKPQGDVQMSGMSVLGNDDSPTSLALVPWKTSQLGDAPSISKLLDDSMQPVDKDVFMRELAYYEIKTDSK